MKRITLLAALVACTAFAHSQTLIQADSATLQAQIGRDENGFSSCGVRALISSTARNSLEMFDFSIVMYRGKLGGLIKAGKYLVSDKDIQRNILPAPVTPRPTKFWIVADTASKPLLAQSISPSESQGFILGIGDFAQSFETIMMIAEGQNMQFALRYPSEKFDRVFGFASTLSDKEAASLEACIADLIRGFQSDLEQQPK